ncbi:hypothetical protein TPAR_06123, partial [Tolypocladium paradoxum]
ARRRRLAARVPAAVPRRRHHARAQPRLCVAQPDARARDARDAQPRRRRQHRGRAGDCERHPGRAGRPAAHGVDAHPRGRLRHEGRHPGHQLERHRHGPAPPDGPARGGPVEPVDEPVRHGDGAVHVHPAHRGLCPLPRGSVASTKRETMDPLTSPEARRHLAGLMLSAKARLSLHKQPSSYPKSPSTPYVTTSRHPVPSRASALADISWLSVVVDQSLYMPASLPSSSKSLPITHLNFPLRASTSLCSASKSARISTPLPAEGAACPAPS